MGEYQIFGVLLVASCVLAAGAAWWLAKRRAGWSVRRVGMIAALPLPGIAAALCLLVIGKAVLDGIVRPEACGLNACAMAMSAGFVLLLQALGVYGVSLVPAFLVTKLAR